MHFTDNDVTALINVSGNWSIIKAGRNITHAYIWLDGIETVLKSKQSLFGLDVTNVIYVGMLTRYHKQVVLLIILLQDQ